MMPDSTESPAAILAHLFRGSEAQLGTKWLESVKVGLSDTSFYGLVVSNDTLNAEKMRVMYSHFRTNNTQMKPTPDRYWKDDPTITMTDNTICLNNPKLYMAACLATLCTGPFGGIL
jgi:hypothetical protein